MTFSRWTGRFEWGGVLYATRDNDVSRKVEEWMKSLEGLEEIWFTNNVVDRAERGDLWWITRPFLKRTKKANNSKFRPSILYSIRRKKFFLKGSAPERGRMTDKVWKDSKMETFFFGQMRYHIATRTTLLNNDVKSISKGKIFFLSCGYICIFFTLSLLSLLFRRAQPTKRKVGRTGFFFCKNFFFF